MDGAKAKGNLGLNLVGFLETSDGSEEETEVKSVGRFWRRKRRTEKGAAE